MWLTCLVLALQSVPATPALDASTALRLLQHSTSFTARSGRVKPEVRRIAPIGEPSAEPMGYLVEASWTVERDGKPEPESGVATVAPMEQLETDAQVLGVEGAWALMGLAAGKGWDDFQRELAEARAAAQESNVLGQLRSILLGQIVFAAEAGGAFAGEWRCLTEPSQCIPGYAANAPAFLQMPATEMDGYRFTLRGKPGPDLGPGMVAAFVATAVPVAAPPEKRSFCADATRLCVLAGPADLAADADACPESCASLE
jgi:hypothetical protein